MNVLFLDQFSELWGAQRCLVDLLPALEERGWQAAVALPGDGPLVKLLRERGVAVHPIPCGPYQSGGKSIADVIRFRRDLRDQVSLLRSIHADLIYVNGPRVLPAAALAFGGRTPVLFHAHNRVGGAIASWLARRSIRKMDATVIACCQAVAPGVRRDRLKIIANGTEDLGFRERAEKPLRIGIVGRVSPEKGQAEFLDAARLLAPGFPDAQFVLCGAPIPPALRKLAEGLPVNFLGWREDVAPVLAELDLLAIPSKTEGMPRVMLEAFSAGVPVVAYPVGGIPEVIADNHTGFLVPERTAEALAARIRGVLMLPQGQLRTVAANARREWERRYTVETYRKNVTDLMERLLLDWQAEHEKE